MDTIKFRRAKTCIQWLGLLFFLLKAGSALAGNPPLNLFGGWLTQGDRPLILSTINVVYPFVSKSPTLSHPNNAMGFLDISVIDKKKFSAKLMASRSFSNFQEIKSAFIFSEFIVQGSKIEPLEFNGRMIIYGETHFKGNDPFIRFIVAGHPREPQPVYVEYDPAEFGLKLGKLLRVQRIKVKQLDFLLEHGDKIIPLVQLGLKSARIDNVAMNGFKSSKITLKVGKEDKGKGDDEGESEGKGDAKDESGDKGDAKGEGVDVGEYDELIDFEEVGTGQHYDTELPEYLFTGEAESVPETMQLSHSIGTPEPVVHPDDLNLDISSDEECIP